MQVDQDGIDGKRPFQVRLSGIAGDVSDDNHFKLLLLPDGSVEIGTMLSILQPNFVHFSDPSQSREPIVSQLLLDLCQHQTTGQDPSFNHQRPFSKIDLPLISGDIPSLYRLSLSLTANGFVTLILTLQRSADRAGEKGDKWIQFYGENEDPFAQCLREIILQKDREPSQGRRA